MRRPIILCAFATLFTAGFSFASGRSDVADAAMKSDKAAIRALLQQKADVNVAQADGATALQWAAYDNNVALAEL